MGEFVEGVAAIEDTYVPFCAGKTTEELIESIQRASVDCPLANPSSVSTATFRTKASYRKYQSIGRGGSGVTQSIGWPCSRGVSRLLFPMHHFVPYTECNVEGWQ